MEKRILLVDDSATHRSLIKVFLGWQDFDFLEAADGAEALETLATNSVDLVIADVKMPGMDGIAFVRNVRQSGNPTIAHMPILLLSAEKDPVIPSQADSVGATAFLRKPVSSAGVLQAVKQALSDVGKWP